MRTIKLAFSALALMPLSACGTSETTAPAAPALAIGETGKANGIEIAVTSVKSTNQVADPSAVPLAGPDETYVVVKYTIKNTASTPLELMNRPAFDLLDANGQVFAKDDIATGVTGAMLDAQGMVKVFFELNGQSRLIKVPDRNRAATSAIRRKADNGNAAHLGAPMPGVISTVAVAAGQPVKAGDVLLSIEAMKMETALHAEKDGAISEVLVRAGDQIDAKDLLIVYGA